MSRRKFEVSCTVQVNHKFEDLSAHVELEGNPTVEPGDQIQVHGEPITPPYGQSVVERRTATVIRATWLERAWTRLTGNFGCVELLDVSFTDRSQP